MKEELYPSPGEKWKNHPDPTSILCFSQGNDTIFQTTLEGSSRLHQVDHFTQLHHSSTPFKQISSLHSHKCSHLKIFTNATAYIVLLLHTLSHKSCLKLTSSRKLSSPSHPTLIKLFFHSLEHLQLGSY